MAHCKSMDEIKRYCPKCKKRKLLGEFSMDRHQNKVCKAGWCIDCIGIRVNKRRAEQTESGRCIEGRCSNFREVGKTRCKDHLLKNRLSALVSKGLLPEDVYRVKVALVHFDGVCPICSTVVQSDKWHVDHDHTTGKFRAIVCGECNRMLGLAKERINLLQRAIIYLTSFGKEAIMAYLNCPYCPSQAVPAPHTDAVLLLGMGLQKFRCNSKHEFYVNTEDVDGNTSAYSIEGSTDRAGTCA